MNSDDLIKRLDETMFSMSNDISHLRAENAELIEENRQLRAAIAESCYGQSVPGFAPAVVSVSKEGP